MTYLGHAIKLLDPARHGRRGFRIERTGEDVATMREARQKIAARVFPYRYIGGPPIKSHQPR